MSQSQMKETDFEVTDKLYEVSEATNSDGTVDVHIEDFHTESDYNNLVVVEFTTPTGEKEDEVMRWPSKDSEEYKFVRICNETVGGLNAAEWLKTDGAEIKADPENWEIITDKSRRERISEKISETSKQKIFEISIGISSLVSSIAIFFSFAFFTTSYVVSSFFYHGLVDTFAAFAQLFFFSSFLIAIPLLFVAYVTLVDDEPP